MTSIVPGPARYAAGGRFPRSRTWPPTTAAQFAAHRRRGRRRSPVDYGAALTPNNLVDYLRGDQAQETTNGGTLRARSSVLGDIVNSEPVISSPRNDYGYAGFDVRRRRHVRRLCRLRYAEEGREPRPNVVYAGANDGMFHAFDGSNGRELFAYVPNGVLGRMDNLALPDSPVHDRTLVRPRVLRRWPDHRRGCQVRPRLEDRRDRHDRRRRQFRLRDRRQQRDIGEPDQRPVGVEQRHRSGSGLQHGQAADPAARERQLGRGLQQRLRRRKQRSDPVCRRCVQWRADQQDRCQRRRHQASTRMPTTTPPIPTTDSARSPRSTPMPTARVDFVYGGDLQGNLWKFDLSALQCRQLGRGVWPAAILRCSPRKSAANGSRSPAASALRAVRASVTACSSVPDATSSSATTTSPSPPQIQTFYGVLDNGTTAGGRREPDGADAEETIDPGADPVSTADDTVIRTTSQNLVSTSGRARNGAGSSTWRWIPIRASRARGHAANASSAHRASRTARSFFATFNPTGDSCVPGGDNLLYGLDLISGSGSLTNVTQLPTNSPVSSTARHGRGAADLRRTGDDHRRAGDQARSCRYRRCVPGDPARTIARRSSNARW